MRAVLLAAIALGLSTATPAPAQDRVRLAVGGKSAVYYLPLSVTERLGYFKDAGIDVEISDVASGGRALQAIVGGSAEIGIGNFDHAIQMQAKGQPVVALVQLGRFPGFALAMRKEKADAYKSPKDLKGMKIGVTAPGSSTHFMVLYMMAQAGLKPDDASFIGTGSGNTVVALLQYGRFPGFVLAMMAGKADRYKTPADLKGLKVGVTSPGSATHFMAAYMMVRNGLKADDASFIATGATSTAIAAARRAEIDAIVSSDPMMTLMESEKLVKIVADTRTPDGTRAVYGGPYPGGVIYATPATIEKNPKAVQAVVDAFVRGLKWIAGHSAEDIANLMPPEYALGNLPIYVRALSVSKPMYSPDGHFVPGAAETAHAVLKVFDPSIAQVTIDLSKTYTDAFVSKAK